MVAVSWTLVTLVGLLVSGSVKVLGAECTANDEGDIVEIDCGGYTRCVNSQPVVTTCESGLVLDIVTRQCVQPEGRTADCDLCAGKPDGLYPEIWNDCRTYFVCTAEVASDRYKCFYPLIFNSRSGSCFLKSAVPPPCGTAGK